MESHTLLGDLFSILCPGVTTISLVDLRVYTNTVHEERLN